MAINTHMEVAKANIATNALFSPSPGGGADGDGDGAGDGAAPTRDARPARYNPTNENSNFGALIGNDLLLLIKARNNT